MSDGIRTDDVMTTYPKWISLLFFGSVFFVLLPIAADNIKYIVASLSVLGIGVYGYLVKDNYSVLPSDRTTYFFLAFIGYSFISVLWSPEPTMALRESFNWLLLISIGLATSTIIRFNRIVASILSKLLAIFFIIFLIFHLGAIQWDIGFNFEWNALMSRSKNYTTTLLTCLSPFLIFYHSKSQFVRFLKIVAVVLLANLLFITGARGALLVFSMILLLKYWNYYARWRYRNLGVIFFALVIVFGVYVLNTSTTSADFIFVEEYRQELASRVKMNQNSIVSIKEQPIWGVGSGQWFYEIYRHGVGTVAPFNATYDTVRYRSHNLYFKMLVELGVVGFILFYGSILGLLYAYKDRWTELSGHYKSAWACLLSFLVVTYFYANAIHYEYFFSGISYMAFLSIGILLSYDDSNKSRPNILPSILVIFGLLCIVWYGYSKIHYNQFNKVKDVVDRGVPQEAIDILEDMYHPYYNANYNIHISYAQKLAEQYAQLGNYPKAKEFYDRALYATPHFEALISSYIRFCIRTRGDLDLAKELVKTLLEIQPNQPSYQSLASQLSVLVDE